jgi:hypothetical protein
MMSVDIMMSLIFRCRHHDESEHNDGRVSPLVNKGEPHFANSARLLGLLPQSAALTASSDIYHKLQLTFWISSMLLSLHYSDQ